MGDIKLEDQTGRKRTFSLTDVEEVKALILLKLIKAIQKLAQK